MNVATIWSIRPWMKRGFSAIQCLCLLVLLSSMMLYSKSFACSFSSPNQSIISLSNPLTHVLYELDLLNSQTVKMISGFSGLTASEFKGEIVGGGQFLSKSMIKKYKNPVVFFDDGLEQRRVLEKINDAKLVGIQTRNKDPFQVVASLLKQLTPYLDNKSCQVNINKLTQKIQNIKQEIEHSSGLKYKTLIFTDKILPGQRLPPMLMLNDGFTLFLLSQKKIQSYPSDLPYVNWSAQILKDLKQKGRVLYVGIDSNTTIKGMKIFDSMLVSVENNRELMFNLTGKTILIPGLGQMYAMKTLIMNLPR